MGGEGVWERQCLATLGLGDIWWPIGDLQLFCRKPWVQGVRARPVPWEPPGVQEDAVTLGVELAAAPGLSVWNSVGRELALQYPSTPKVGGELTRRVLDGGRMASRRIRSIIVGEQ